MATLLRVSVDSTTLQQLQAKADATRLDLELVAQRQLTDAARLLPLGTRVVVLSGATLEALESILGGGSLMHGADCLKKVERLAGISFLHLRLPFTPNQLEWLAEKAAREGTTVERMVERVAPRVYEQFFDLLARV